MTRRDDWKRWPRVSATRKRGKLPAWIWESLHAVSRDRRPDDPVMLIVEGERPVVVIDLADWNTRISAWEALVREVDARDAAW